jgi:hypothetical protein
VTFSEATFSGQNDVIRQSGFRGRETTFDKVAFGSEHTSFNEASFSGEIASFATPRSWHDVSFDWDRPAMTAAEEESGISESSRTAMPQCISPRQWPPEVDA